MCVISPRLCRPDIKQTQSLLLLHTSAEAVNWVQRPPAVEGKYSTAQEAKAEAATWNGKDTDTVPWTFISVVMRVKLVHILQDLNLKLNAWLLNNTEQDILPTNKKSIEVRSGSDKKSCLAGVDVWKWGPIDAPKKYFELKKYVYIMLYLL